LHSRPIAQEDSNIMYKNYLKQKFKLMIQSLRIDLDANRKTW